MSLDDAALVAFDPTNVNLDTVDQRDVICYFQLGGNDYDGRLGLRVSALVIILVTSSLATTIPLLAARRPKWLPGWFSIPLYGYLFARNFGAGVIVATAFVHLLDPAYGAIGSNTCVGMTGSWAGYAWAPAIMLCSSMLLFLVDFVAQFIVDGKYGLKDSHSHGGRAPSVGAPVAASAVEHHLGHDSDHLHHHTAVADMHKAGRQQHTATPNSSAAAELKLATAASVKSLESEAEISRCFQEQFSAFLILEFGVIFHSVLIGMNLAVAGDEFSTLYAVIVFHQAFEGLGIGARLSAIPFPRHLRWLPWVLCLIYGLCTPIGIAAGLIARTSYSESTFTANVVSGIFDSVSAGILLYTGFVELLARDFIFNHNRTNDRKIMLFQLASVFLGAGLMALLGKWA